jgi:hypothetical protein
MREPIITVTVVPKRPQYWRRTIEILDAAGARDFKDKYIMVDGDGSLFRQDTPPGWTVHECHDDKTTRGTYRTMRKSLIYGDLERDRLFFEDDLEDPVDDAVTAMAEIKVPWDCAFLSFVDLRKGGTEPKIVRKPGFDFSDIPVPQDHIGNSTTIGGHWGNQALKIPSRSLKFFSEAHYPTHESKHASDVDLGIILATSPAPWPHIGYVEPSFFRHAGTISAVMPIHIPFRGYGRETRNCPGPGYKALEILNKLV